MYGYRPCVFSGNDDAVRINDEGAQGPIWLLYNHIYDLTHCINPSNSAATSYIVGNKLHACNVAIGNSADFVINNAIFNVQEGISQGEAKNNLIANASSFAIRSGVTNCSHNLVWQGSVQAACTNQILADPKMVMSGIDTTGLQADSPAIDAGFPGHSVYETYQSAYGVDIRVDFNGTPRPQAAGWDIGAFEFGGGPSGGPPSAPANLVVG